MRSTSQVVIMNTKYLDRLGFDIGFPDRFAEDDSRCRDQVPDDRSITGLKPTHALSSSHSQATSTVLQLHKEHAVLVRCLKCRHHGLSFFACSLAVEHEILHLDEFERLPDERKRRWRPREYQELLVCVVLEDLRGDLEGVSTTSNVRSPR